MLLCCLLKLDNDGLEQMKRDATVEIELCWTFSTARCESPAYEFNEEIDFAITRTGAFCLLVDVQKEREERKWE